MTASMGGRGESGTRRRGEGDDLGSPRPRVAASPRLRVVQGGAIGAQSLACPMEFEPGLLRVPASPRPRVRELSEAAQAALRCPLIR